MTENLSSKKRKLCICSIVMLIVAVVLSVILLLIPLLMGLIGTADDGAFLVFLKENVWSDFLGAFHPLTVHLPIGSLLLIFCLEITNLFKKEGKFPMMFPLLFNAVSSVLASLLGILWYYGGDSFSQASDLLDSHMWKGLIYASCAVWLPVIYYICKPSYKGVYCGILCGSVLLMTIASHDGGDSVHGDPLDKAPWIVDEKKPPGSTNGEDTGDTQGGQIPDEQTVADFVTFRDVVTPILTEKCYACHHSSEKVKSDLKFDTYADILKGGEYQEDTPTLIPGDVENSYLIVSIELPDDDELHMPPPKKDQVTEDELKLLKWWVAEGAPEKKTLGEMNAPAEILKLVLAQEK